MNWGKKYKKEKQTLNNLEITPLQAILLLAYTHSSLPCSSPNCEQGLPRRSVFWNHLQKTSEPSGLQLDTSTQKDKSTSVLMQAPLENA